MTTRRRAVSVRDEVMTIEAAVRGAVVLVQHGVGVDDHEARMLQPMIEGVLSLVACRLHDLERAMHGDVDPAMFLASHNAAPEGWVLREKNEFLLEEWTPEELATHGDELLRRAGARRRDGKR